MARARLQGGFGGRPRGSRRADRQRRLGLNELDLSLHKQEVNRGMELLTPPRLWAVQAKGREERSRHAQIFDMDRPERSAPARGLHDRAAAATAGHGEPADTDAAALSLDPRKCAQGA